VGFVCSTSVATRYHHHTMQPIGRGAAWIWCREDDIPHNVCVVLHPVHDLADSAMQCVGISHACVNEQSICNRSVEEKVEKM